MSTTFQPSLASYDSHGMHKYQSPMAYAGHMKAAMDESKTLPYYRYPPQQYSAVDSQAAGHYPRATIVQQATKPLTPLSSAATTSLSDNSDALIYHSLDLPKRICASGGNLADFAAQMTCLFWFQSVDELKQAESIRSNGPVSHLSSLAKPHDQFRKWVYNVLSTTQVTQNVILLALLFIYRLKVSSPKIKGRAGSEYRLLTVALMLGNKFLDDNTYMNKTWAEVSSFAVQDIHVMEVEFLSNMRYNLLATKTQWEEWLDKLGYFHEYYERALRLPVSPIRAISPASNGYHSPTRSPTAVSQPAAPMQSITPTSRRSQHWPSYPGNAVSPLANKAVALPSRKRSPDGDVGEHPAKRFAPNRAAPMAPANMLPVPHLTLVTDHIQNTPPQYPNTGNHNYQPSQQLVGASQGSISLPPLQPPPLQPGVRAMTTVFQSVPPSAVQHQAPLTVTTSAPMPPATYTGTAIPNHVSMSYGTPSKHHSPSGLGPYASSPLTENFPPTSAMQTPISNSPSVYLQQRPSPYKPVRHVNTLLYPPPSASLDQYHLSVSVPPTQMHYQPLGRRYDLRTGILPEFVAYNQDH